MREPGQTRLGAAGLLIAACLLAAVFPAHPQSNGAQTAGPEKAPATGWPNQAAGGMVLRTQTNVVLVDVRVRGRDGRPVTDLAAKDFRVFEDGVEQKVASFSLENVEQFAAAAAEAGAPATLDLSHPPANVPAERLVANHRLLVLFFDMTSMQVDDLNRALGAAEDFVNKQMAPADLVAVVIYASSLRPLQNFTNDRTLLLGALKRLRPGEAASLAEAGSEGEAGTTNTQGQEVVAQDVSAAFTPDETEFNIFNTDEKLAAMESLARLLRNVPGRKSVIHFSSGVERTGIENQAQLLAAIDAANRANVSFYSMDARGLVALPSGGDASSSSPAGTAIYSGQAHASQIFSLQGGRETLASLAADTGGRTFYDLNDFSSAFRDVQEDNTTYYLLGYTPSNLKSDGRYRRLRVEVDRPGVKIQARPGYYAPKDFRQFTHEDREVQLAQAMDSDLPFVELPLAVEAAYFRRADKKYDLVLAAKIPGSAASFLKKSGKNETEFDFAWRVADAAGRPVGALRDTLSVRLAGEDYARVLAGNILYEGQLVLPAGKYSLKTVVRENASGRIGTFEQPLELPAAGALGLSLSSVVLSNQVEEGRDEASKRGRSRGESPLSVGARTVLPSVTRVFRPSQKLYVYAESYETGAAKSAASGAPAVQPQIALVFFRGGVKVAEAGPFEGKREKSGAGRAVYFVEMPLEKFPPGRYRLQLNVIDPAAGLAAFARVPMAVARPAAAARAAASGH